MFLLAFVPVIMGLGGSIGNQASTVALRGLASGKLGSGDSPTSMLGFLGQQLRVAAVLGLACGGIAGLAALLLKQHAALGLVVGVALFFAMVLAALAGAVVPSLLEKLGLDPAIANGPVLTAANDIIGILIYFGLAARLLAQLAP